MNTKHNHQSGCCCDRRGFISAMGASVSALAFQSVLANSDTPQKQEKESAVIIGAFLYPPSDTLRKPGAWWSWPGNDFDAEGRQKEYMKELRAIEKRLNIRLDIIDPPLYDENGADKFINQVKQSKPDAILLIPFFNWCFNLLDRIIDAANPEDDPAIPSIVFSCLGVHHGSILKYQCKNIHFIQSLDNLDAIGYGLNMIRTRKIMANSRIISVAGAVDRKEAVVPFWGTKVRRVSLKRFEEEVNNTDITSDVKKLAHSYQTNAKKILEPDQPEILQAAKVHFANKRILQSEQGDAIMMDCLRRGEMMPCMSFMTLRDEGIAAGCENDLGPTLTLMLAQYLFDRPGFQHNPCFETESNHYFASHCTSGSKLHGTDQPAEPFLLRNYGHTNDPTCCPQVLFSEGKDVTMAHCIPTEKPQMLLYSGTVVKSYEMPPVGGCRTNVEITINELDNVCEVKGHHNVLFYGNYTKQMKQFARLYGIEIVI